MAEHTFDELSDKTVAELREIAEGVQHEAVQGHKTMHKKTLVVALCNAFGVEARTKRAVVGIDKPAIKGQIRALKTKRVEVRETHDRAELKKIRRKIHRLKRSIRRATV